MSALVIVRPGMLTTVQDLGRWGFQSRGVAVSGALDLRSHRIANRLVGNADADATLEVTLMGPQIRFEGEAVIAIAGAEFKLTVDDAPVAMNEAVEVNGGALLKFGSRVRGTRAYFAVGGGIDVPRVLGSRSTHVLTATGGHLGRALRAEDRLEVGSSAGSLPAASITPVAPPAGGARLRVVPSSAELTAQLVSRRFQVSPQSNRMGYRLEGGDSLAPPSGTLLSGAVPTGAIQVPPTGQPILLMSDRATTGGYAIAATVISADLPVAAQLGPGDWIEFEPCTVEQADSLLREQEASIG